MAAVSQPFRLADLCAGARGPVRARLAMTFWGLHQGTAGGTRDAFQTHRHGAAQPVGNVPSDQVAECVGIRVVSFNCGIQQTMLESGKQWNQKHAKSDGKLGSAVLLSLRCPRGFSPGERRAQFQTRHRGTAHQAHTISIAPGKTKHTAQQC